MSPIDGVSDIVRMPRLGKIRLGIKVEGEKSTYPKAVDYFVCPPEVQAVFGEKPKELKIMFPVEDENMFAQQWLRRYSLTQGLTCIGTGEYCRRKVDVETGDIASHTTKEWVWKDDLICDSDNCPEYQSKICRRVMNLQFLIPSVPGLGVWQIDTSSFYSIVNINSMIKMIRGLFGRCSMLPLTLALGEIEVSPAGQKKKRVYIMHIRQDDIRLAELARLAELPISRVLIPSPATEEPPDDLFPEDILTEYGSEPTPAKNTKKNSKKKASPEKPPEENQEQGQQESVSELEEFFEEIPEVDPDAQKAWSNVKNLLNRKNPPAFKIIENWFSKHYQTEVCREDFERDICPEKFNPKILSHFHDSMLAFYENQGRPRR